MHYDAVENKISSEMNFGAILHNANYRTLSPKGATTALPHWYTVSLFKNASEIVYMQGAAILSLVWPWKGSHARVHVEILTVYKVLISSSVDDFTKLDYDLMYCSFSAFV